MNTLLLGRDDESEIILKRNLRRSHRLCLFAKVVCSPAKPGYRQFTYGKISTPSALAPNILAMTTLVAVRETLQNLNSNHAELFMSLVENGKNAPYRCSKTIKQQFGPSDLDFPTLGKRLSPFATSTLPSAEELRLGCLQDAQDAKIFSGVSSSAMNAGSTTDYQKEPKLQSMGDIVDAQSSTPATLSFPSPYLESFCQEEDKLPETVLRESMMTCMMFPDDTMLPLQHSNEGMTYATLLSGSVIWIMWPSTKYNIEIIQSVYEKLARGSEHVWVEAVGELQGGIFFKQIQGECLRISPLCPMICLSTEASMLATYSVLDAHELVSTLRRLPFLKMWFKTETDGEQKQNEFNSAMVEYLKLILQGDFDSFKKFPYPFTQEGPLKELLSTWDEVKDCVADLLGPVDAEALRGAWLEFLMTARGRSCWICGTYIYSKKKSLGKHFDERHWTSEKANDAEMSNEIEGTNGPKSMGTPGKSGVDTID
jgi:hypothetical protein